MQSKGIDKNIIEDYFYENRDQLNEYEIKSIEKIILKKNEQQDSEIIQSLLKKGFEYDNVKVVLERRN